MYGGGSKGLMGTVSGAALAAGGQVTGIIPYAIVAAGGERGQDGGADHATYVALRLTEKGRERVRLKSVYLHAMRRPSGALAWKGRRCINDRGMR